MKKILLVIIIGIIATSKITTGVFAPPYYRSTNDNILAEVVVWPNTSRAYYFVIKNNGTLVGYYGPSQHPGVNRPPDFQPQRRDFLRMVLRRNRVVLSEEDFLNISRLVNDLVIANTVDGTHGRALTSSYIMFSHNGNIYDYGSAWPMPLMELNRILLELTSLRVR